MKRVGRSRTDATLFGPDQPTLFLPFAPTPADLSTATASTAPKDALLEVQQIKPGADAERSWFVDQAVVSGPSPSPSRILPRAYLHPVPVDGALTLLTPFDPLFLLLVLLSAPSLHGTDAFLPAADLWDKVSDVEWGGDAVTQGVEMREDVLKFAEMECVQRRLVQCCETKGAPVPHKRIR